MWNTLKERYLLESDEKAALESEMETLQKNLTRVTNEKVVALMELAQLKQEYNLLQEKLNEDKLVIDKEEKNMIHDKDGRLKSLLKKTYFSECFYPQQDYAQNISKNSSSATTDFAKMKVEYISHMESLKSMEHLASTVRRLRLSLIKVKKSVSVLNTVSDIIENVETEAKLLKMACVPVSWSDELDTGEGKVDAVSAAGFEMVELLILATQLLKSSMS
ncbi:unnamed protein product [Lactuca saligna]|uniref:Uncharacterized protein n=1 Tax=Lactuca saligna TaxID=75948 RepID=A0AA36EPZ0_LACSI|nr:unnamed protein product [Lactuca saligna]